MHSAMPKPTDYGREFCLRLVRSMLRIRRMEERCAHLYGEGKIRGFLHLYIGEEAVAAGVMANLRPEDAVVVRDAILAAIAKVRANTIAMIFRWDCTAAAGCSICSDTARPADMTTSYLTSRLRQQ